MKANHRRFKTIFLSIVFTLLYQFSFIQNSLIAQTTISNFDNFTISEKDPAKIIAPNIIISGTSNYADSYIEFTYTGGGNADETLAFVTVASPVVTLGEVSIVGTNIYLGDGTTAKKIGVVDNTYNGLNGNNLRINFSSPLTNANFTDEVVNGVIPGWTPTLGTITLGALASRSQGNLVSASGSAAPYTITGTGYTFQSDQQYDASIRSAWGYESVERPINTPTTTVTVVDDADAVGGKALYLTIRGSVGPNGTPPKYGSHFGPEAWSDAFDASAGDQIKLSFKAVRSSDHYECYGYLVNTSTNVHTMVLYGRGGNLAWTEVSGTIPVDGNYKFRFVNGTYDASGGKAVGSNMWIDNIRIAGSDATDELIQKLVRKVSYENESCTPAATREINLNAKNTDGNIATASLTVTINPIIVTFNVGSISDNQSICSGTPDKLVGLAPTGGSSFSYQWQSSSDGTTFADITGATSLDYQPNALTATTYYKLWQSNGCESAYTNVVTITVYPEFVVGSISANQTICYNTSPAELIGVAPTGGNGTYTYQWQSSTDNSTFTDITGATNLNYQAGALTTTTYFQLIQSTICGSLTTNRITIVVYEEFVVGSISSNQNICYNSTPAQLVGVAPSGGVNNTRGIPDKSSLASSYTYQWQSSSDGTTFADITGATSLDYQPGALTATTYYQLVQSCDCGDVTTNMVTITVYPDFVVGSISNDQFVCGSTIPDELIGIAPTGGGTAVNGVAVPGSSTYTYQWQSSTDGTTFTNISGATSLNYQPGALTATTYYKLIQSSGCGDLTTNTVTITVYPEFVVGSISADQTLCFNSDPVELVGVAPTGGDGSYTYQWQSSTDNTTFTDITGATSLNYQPGALTTTTYYQLLQSSGCGTLITNKITITVYPEFVVGSISASQSICYNTSPTELVGVAPTGGDGSYTYQWQVSTDNSNFTNISGATSLNYQAGALTATTYYQLLQTSGCGETFTTNKVTITVYPPYVVGSISGNQTICYDTSPNELIGVAPTGGDGTYTYQWQSSTDNSTFTDISGATSLNYQAGALTATTYYLLVQSSLCADLTTNKITITVRPFVPHPLIVEKKLAENISLLVVDNSDNLYFDYLWSYGNGSDLPFDLVNDRQFLTLPIAHMNATYKVTAFDTNNCGVSSLSKTVTPAEMLSSVYPTISNGNFKMALAGPEMGQINVKIYNEMGRLLKTYQFEKMSNTESIPIIINDLKAGSYFVEISINNYKEAHRVFIR